MLPFGVTIPATVPQGSEIPEGLMNNPVHKRKQKFDKAGTCWCVLVAVRADSVFPSTFILLYEALHSYMLPTDNLLDKKTNVFATGDISTNTFIRQFQLLVRKSCGCLRRTHKSRATDLSRGCSPHPSSPIERFRIHNFRISFQSEDVRVP